MEHNLTLEEKQAIHAEMARLYQKRKRNFTGGRPRTRPHTGKRNCACADCRKAKVGGPRGIAAAAPEVQAQVRAKAAAGVKRRAAQSRLKKGREMQR